MKKWIAILLIICMASAYGTLTITSHRTARVGGTLEVRQFPYALQVATVTGDATALAAGTSHWEAIKDSNFVEIDPGWNTVELAFYGFGDGDGIGNPNNTTFAFRVFACRPYSSAKLVYQGTGAMGALQLSTNPVTQAQFRSGLADPNYTFCDTLATAGSGDDWTTAIVLSGEGATDGVATLRFASDGYYGLWCEITAMTGQSVSQIWCLATGD